MPGLQLIRGRSDVQIAEKFRVDLTLRQWSVDPGGFTLGDLRLEADADTRVVVIVPSGEDEFDVCLRWIGALIDKGRSPILLWPEAFAFEAGVLEGLGGVVYRGTLPYDQTFEELYRILIGDLPPWLDLRVRPSLIQSPTGVAWWADDLFIADDRYDHVVRISPNDSTVVLPGLFEPHHISVDRRKLTIANKSADEVISCDIVDNMAANVETIHDLVGERLQHPHAGVMTDQLSAVADTDNDRVLFRLGDGDWQMLRPELPFSRPCGVCTDRDGIWVADTFNHRVLKFDKAGNELVAFGSYGDGRIEFNYPVGIQRWNNLLFVADERSERLKVFEIYEQEAGISIVPQLGDSISERVSQPFGIAINRNNRLAIADRKQKCIWIVDLMQLASS